MGGGGGGGTVLNYLSTILNDLSDFIFFDLWLRSFLRYSNIIAANPFCVCVCVYLCLTFCVSVCVCGCVGVRS